ncbi:hypothetical protein D1AOALGA4SA_2620 [Olavius algarvensis Delta 1 endosymbiont]|nr:hypothetical protein D1AOALGA4SA_2620 [Olavius algarvensis Delta 1 endosymbiont]
MTDQLDTFIDDEFLRQLEKLKIVSRKSTRNPRRGEYRSWQSGEGFEFLDFRKYHLGDDLRYVDWSVYGRLDKLFIKLFHAEKGQTAHILLDTSRSMGSGNPSKDITAKKIAAALSYICLSNLDKTGLMAFNNRIVKTKPPARGKTQYLEMLQFFQSLQPTAQTDLNGSLKEYAAICKNPGIAIVISDFFDPVGYQDGLKALAYRDFDINLIQVMDHEELYWSRTGNLLLNECETGEKKVTFVDKDLLRRYRQKINGFIAGIKNYCGHYGMNYFLCDTRIPFEKLLTDYLSEGALFR